MYYFFLFCLIGCAFAQQNNELNENNWESPAAQYLGLAAGASSVVPNIRATFSCIGRSYGYFADVDNNCQIFHVCHPSVSASGEPVIYHFSKFCPKSTRFDQRQLTCLSETDPKLLSCSDSVRFYAPFESRLADVPVVQRLEGIQDLPEIQQRVESLTLDEPRREALPVKGIQTEVRSQSVLNEGIPAKTVIRSEALPQQIPVVEQKAEQFVQFEPFVQQREEPFVQRAEPLIQEAPEPIAQRAEPLAVKQPIQQFAPLVAEVRNVEPIQQQAVPITEPLVPVVAQRSPVKQNVIPVAENLRASSAVAPKGYVAPAFALRNNQQSVPSAPLQITRPVLLESDLNLRRTVPQTQYVPQTQSLVQPLYVPQQYIQRYIVQTPRVIRPSQYSEVVNRRPVVAQQPIVYIPVQTNYRTIPQYLRTNVQPNVVRPSQNPTVGRALNKQ